MKLKNYILYTAFFFFFLSKISAQSLVPFTSRSGNFKIKGDITLIGNNIINVSSATNTTQANTPYNGTANNNGLNQEYIDVDSDATTFSSSSAGLNLTTQCRKIVYAGLYWSATYPYDRAGTNPDSSPSNTIGTARLSTFNQIKLKLPNTATYIPLVADNSADAVGQEDQIIFDGYNAANPTNSVTGAPYTCYKNITSLVQAMSDPNGTYFVADMIASKGVSPEGNSGGWTIVFVYEDQVSSNKYITVFDGFAAINNTAPPLDFAVNGFRTAPTPTQVRAKIGLVGLDGDIGANGDNLSFKANLNPTFSAISNSLNPAGDFFNSTITDTNLQVATRIPNSSNTLGFDQDIIDVNNPANSVIPNNETGATYRVNATNDPSYVYLSTFAVEISEPKIALTKIVTDNLGNPISTNVVLGQNLNYVVGFQNTGNENVTNFTVRDVLPNNIIFDYPADLVLPAGVTSTYTAATRTLLFTIPNGLVEINDPRYEILIKVKVVQTCYELATACSNNITNQAFATYRGAINNTLVTDDPSYATYTACLAGSPAPTNFIVGLDGCQFRKTEVLCGTSLTLTAALGYTNYSWSSSATGSPILGTSQTLTVTAPGTYYVFDTVSSPCVSITEVITVIPFGNNVTNPVIPYADEVVICPNDGKQLPNIFLCGISDSQLIQTNIQDATSISWQRLTVGSCPVIPNAFCANENIACTWTSVGASTNYTANSPGQYRVVINYPGGCFNIFYFNVYQNTLSPVAVTRDIICTTSGNITVNNVPSGYEYSFTTSNVPGAYSATNTFTTNTAGSYNVFIRQTGVGANACVFQILNLPIVVKSFTATIITIPIDCDGDKATIKVAANNVLPQYTFTLREGTTVKGTSGLINASDFTFTGVDAGTYTVTTTSQDGCTNTQTVIISNVRALGLIATLTQPLTPCSDAIVTLTASGGNGIYEYKEGTNNGNGTYRPGNVFTITSPGLYTFQVDDTTKCDTGITTLNITLNPTPVFSVLKTDIKCSGGTNGQIIFSVSNTNGYTIQYSINGGSTYLNSNTFTNLAPGTYPTSIQYGIGNAVACSTAIQNIIINEPAFALTASGGVSAVACDTNGGLGTIRITNPQGGTLPYQYNLGAGYSAINTRQVAPGNYTISIRDANLCVFTMNVTVDPIPQVPTIGIQSPVFNCNGSATTTVIVNNGPSNYAYTYSNNGILNTPPSNNVFTNVLCGANTFSINYQLTSVSTYSTLLFEDFGSGANTKTPGIASAYCWNNQPFPPGQPCSSVVVGYPPADCSGTGPYGSTYVLEDNQYVVTSALNPNICVWYDYRDHTSNGADPKGRFLAVNIGDAAGDYGVLYSKQINDVLPNQPISVELYVANLIRAGYTGFDNPDFLIELVDSSNKVIASQLVGAIDNIADAWQFKSISLNPGANTSLTFKIRSGSIELYGNDAAIDDIRVFQLPVTCLNQRVFPTDIPCGKAFTAQVTSFRNVSCAGANDGKITIAAQNFRFPQGFEYSIDGGASYLTSNISPVVIDNLLPNAYDIRIRFDSSASSCSATISQTISAPGALISSASVTTQATCLVGAVITASAAGGTAPYQYQLTNEFGSSILVPYQTAVTFSNVPAGNYLVYAIDANGCIDPINSPITVSSAIAPSATISVTSNYCVSGGGGGTIIVNATGGKTPYEYSSNNGTSFQTSNTFTNLVPGTYTIILRDANSCLFALSTQTIRPQLTLGLALKDLDCTALPGAVITGTVGGGYAPFTYTIKYNTDPPSGPIAATGTTFSYATAAAGTYLFTVTDSRGCTTQSTQIINTLLKPTATTTVENISCTVSSGTVTINASGGNPAYLYSFNGSVFTSNTTYTGLAAGSYNYIVKDIKQCEFASTVIVTQPAVFLSASAGVSELACANNNGNGIIRVTNPQNGTPPYAYNFNNAGYQSLNQATLPPGSYNILIRDNLGCVFAMSATIDPLPAAPTVTLASPTYNCDGTSTSTITVNSGLVNYTYSYFIDGKLNTNVPPNIFTNVPCGRSVISTNYELTTPPSFSNLLFEDFGAGEDTTASGIASAYCWTNQPYPPNQLCGSAVPGFPTPAACGTYTIENNAYNVTNDINPNNCVWWDVTDRGGNPDGRFLAVNIGFAAGPYGVLYSKVINDVIPNQPVLADIYLTNLLKVGVAGTDPDFILELVTNPGGISIASKATGVIDNDINGWVLKSLSLNPGNNTSLIFNVRSGSLDFSGNDAAIDDINVYQLPKVCVNTVNFPVDIDCKQAFAAQVTNVQNVSCNGVPNGQMTINAQNFNLPYGFDYSTDGGSTWTNSQVSTVVVTGLPAAIYNVNVRFNDVSVGCTISATPTISQPLVLAASATVTTQATCLTGATITASGSGGVVQYQFQLTDTAGTTIIRPYQGGTTFTNVPVGDYLVSVRDANGCIDPINVPIAVVGPTPVSATIAATSKYCISGSGGATLVVTATGGTGAIEYSITPNVFQASNTFSNLGAGTYNITVRDSYGCIFPLPAQTIRPQLTLGTVLTKDLDCTTTNPDAIITGTIGGGYPSFNYTVSYNSGVPSGAIAVTGTTFTYNAALAGTYLFTVTDNLGCTAQSTYTILPITNPVIASVSQTQQILCSGESTAAINITLTPNFGTGPFVYTVLNTTTGTNYGTQTSGLAAGNYTITVTDAKFCTDIETGFIIAQPAPVSYTITKTDITCTGAGTTFGSISVIGLTGGVGPFTYVLTGNNGTPPQTFITPTTLATDHTFTVINFGIYEMNVIDSNFCVSKTQNIIMTSPPNDLDISASASSTCATGGTVVVQVTTSPATGNYFFAIYQAPYPLYTVSPTLFQPVDPPGTLPQATFTNLIPGVTYSFIVYDTVTQCYYFEQATVPIPQASSLVSTINQTNNVTCNGSSDATVSFTINGFNATEISYQIFNSQSNSAYGASSTLSGLTPGSPTTVNNFGPLPPGIYYIVFTEIDGSNAGCKSASAPFTITQSAIPLSVTASSSKNDNCNLNAGVVGIIAQGGTSPYSYQLLIDSALAPLASSLAWVSTNTFNAESGDYIAYVKDANGCIQSATVTIGLDPTPTFVLALPLCPITEGTSTILVSLATPSVSPYTFSLDGGAFQNQTVPFTYNNLNSGTHTIVIQDANGCSSTQDIIIYAPLTNTLATTALPTCILNNDGVITATPLGGSGFYDYTISPVSGTILGNVFSGLPADTYAITLTDTTTSCSITTSVTLGAPTAITAFAASSTRVSCLNGNDGSITVNLVPASIGINDNPLYSYSIISGPVLRPSQPSNVFTNLPIGSYQVKTVSGRLCESIQNVDVDQITPLTVSATATAFVCDSNNVPSVSIVTLTAVDGTPNYNYSIDGTNYGLNNVFEITNTGVSQTVVVYAKDLNGCIASSQITIAPLPTITATSVSRTIAITCTNPETVTINVAGGSGNYNYQLGTSGIPQASPNFILTAPGFYNFQVIDMTTGCKRGVATYIILPFDTATVIASQQAAVVCFGQVNGSINVNVFGYSGNYNYNLLNASNVSVVSGTTSTTTNPLLLTGLAAGNYTVQIEQLASPFCPKTSNIVNIGTPIAPVSVSIISNINANCNTGAQVTIQGSGGTAPYGYAFVTLGSPPPLSTAYTTIATTNLNPVTSASWDIWVKDANGCTASTNVLIITDPQPTVTNTTALNANCLSDGNSYVVTVAGTGTAPLLYNIGNGFVSGTTPTGTTFIVTAPGNYIVTITDGNGCTAQTASITILPILQVGLSIVTLPSCIDGDGIISVNAQGGSGNYEYQLDALGFQPASSIINVTSGNHTITVRDILTDCIKSATVTISVATPVTLNAATLQNVTCFSGSDGSITVNLAPTSIGINDNPTYSYSISGTVVRPNQPSNVFTNLLEGNYIISVLSGRACVATQTVNITDPDPIIVPNASVTQFGCVAGLNAPNFATVSISGVIGGSGVYNIYNFVRNGVIVQSSSATTYVDSNFLGATYTVTVFDDKGCAGATTASSVINPFISISNAVVAVNNAVTCSTLEDITITVSASSGSPTLNYTVTGVGTSTYNQTNTSGNFTGLAIGDYQIVVTNPATGCSIRTFHYVTNPNTFALNIQNLADVVCYGSNEGSVSLTFVDLQPSPVNSAGGFNYVISGPSPSSGTAATAGPITISNLRAGTYSVTATLTGSPQCPATFGFTIQQSDLPLSASASQTASVTCENNKGVIVATASGGWSGNYQYELSGDATVSFSNNYLFDNLEAGNYIISARDSKGCTVSTTITLSVPTAISASISTNAPSVACFGAETGSITVSNTAGGQGSGYLYTLNYLSYTPTRKSGPFASNVFTGLAAGNYSVTIQDGYKCETTLSATIAEPTKVKADLSISSLQTCQRQAVLLLTGSGGTPPYTYSTNGTNFSTVTFNPSTTITVISGEFNYYIKDANGCVAFSNNAINPAIVPLTVDISSSVISVNCTNDATGSIVAKANGGLGNYSYILQNITTGINLPPRSSGVFNNLVAGTYVIQVTSNDCNAAKGPIIITQPAAALSISPQVVPVTCFGAGDGKVTITASGGTPPYIYSIFPNLDQFSTSNTFEKLIPGTYDMIIQDANGCFLPYRFPITQPLSLTSNLQSIDQQELCFNDRNAAFTFSVAGGSLPYRYSIDNSTGPFTTGGASQTIFNIVNQTGGLHTVYILDANGCSTAPIIVNLNQSVDIRPLVTPKYFCPDDLIVNEVTVSVNPLVVGQVQYSLDGGTYQASNVYPNLSAGPHFINVRHLNGCITPSSTFTIAAVAPLTLNLFKGGLNEIVSISSGGNGGNVYTINGGSPNSTGSFIIDATATYTVTVTDKNGCDTSATIPMEFIDIFIPNVFTPNGDGNNDGWTPQNTFNYKNLVFYIYDRYGRKIMTGREGQLWDGMYNGAELPSGDYWYLIKIAGESGNGREFVGNVTLYR